MVTLYEQVIAVSPQATFTRLVSTDGVTRVPVDPNAVALVNDGAGDVIAYWPTAVLGPKPSDAQLAAVTQQQATTALQTMQQAPAISLLSAIDSATGIPDGLRAIVLEMVSEINLLRERLTAQDNVVAAFSGSTAAAAITDFKNRWAAVASGQPMPDRTNAQARQAIINQINNGNANT